MKAKDLYPREAEYGYFCVCDYQPILDSFGDIVVQVDDDDYQGDSRVLYKLPDGQVGYLNFGWGSCSGCDSLQACKNYEEIDELIVSLESDIITFPNKEDALHYFNNHDWKGDYTWHRKEQHEFIKECIKFLSE